MKWALLMGAVVWMLLVGIHEQVQAQGAPPVSVKSQVEARDFKRLRIMDVGVQGGLVNDSLQPRDSLNASSIRLFAQTNVAGKGPVFVMGNRLSGVDRAYFAIHSALYAASDSGQAVINFLVRKSQTDSTLRRSFGIRQDGALVIGSDTANEYRFPQSRGLAGQVLKISSGGNVAWANDSGGVASSSQWFNVGTGDTLGFGKSGGADTILTIGDRGDSTVITSRDNPSGVLFPSSVTFGAALQGRPGDGSLLISDDDGITLNGADQSVITLGFNRLRFTLDTLRDGAGDDLVIKGVDWLSADSATMTRKIKVDTISARTENMRVQATGDLHLVADSTFLSTATLDTILLVTEAGDTTRVLPYDNSVLSLGAPGLATADSLAVRKLYVDSVGGRLFHFPRSKAGTDSLVLGYVSVTGGADSLAWISRGSAGAFVELDGDTTADGAVFRITNGELTGLDTIFASVLTGKSGAGLANADSILFRSIQLNDTVDGSHQIIHRAPGLTADQVYTWPTSTGSSGQFLQTNGLGILTWATSSGGSGDAVQIDTTLAAGGVWDMASLIVRADSGLGLNRIGSTDTALLYIKTSGITSSMINNGSVTGGDIGADQIDSTKLQNNSVSINELAPNAVGISEMTDDAVDSAEIRTSAVKSAEIFDGTITSADVANGSLDSTDILNAGISAGDINFPREEIEFTRLHLTDSASVPSAETSWVITDHFMRKGSTPIDDTLYLAACSSKTGSDDTLFLNFQAHIPYNFIADSVVFRYKTKTAGASSIQFDSLLVFADTLSGGSSMLSGHIIYQDAAVRTRITLEDTSMAVSASGGTSLYRGRKVRARLRLNCLGATSANSVFWIHSMGIVGRRRS